MFDRFGPLMLTLTWLVVMALMVPATAGASAPAQATDKSLSPYFFVKGGDASVDKLPLQGTQAEVRISGVIAHVRVTQIYKNDGTRPIEAVYVFPGSTRAAVFGMQMTVDGKVIRADIQRREAARRMYEQARQQGQSASLLEQQRPNVFQMNVANILPGDEIKVEMDYTELLQAEDGVYEFVYPAVVGPRYTEHTASTASSHDRFTQQPTLPQGEAIPYTWDLQVQLDAGVPIHNLVSPSHRLDSAIEGVSARVDIADGERGGDRDFVLRYALQGDAVSTGLILFPGATEEDEKFFLTMVQPPKAIEDVAVPKREYVFIVDVSGSMRGFPLNTAKRVVGQLFQGLRSEDRFNVMMFSGGRQMLDSRSVAATPANLERAMSILSGMRGGGSTRLLPALREALAMPAAEGMSRTFVVVTDGFVSVEPETFELIRERLGEANLFAFGIGRSVNRHLIEGMARVGMGEPFVALNQTEAASVARRFERYIASPALTNIQVEFPGFDAYDVEPAAVPDLFAQRPVIVFGKYRGAPRGSVVVKGITGRGEFERRIDVSSVREDAGNSALRTLWARHRIARLADLNRLRADDARVEEVTQLGLKYSLMTAYTSFVAIDERVRNQGGESTQVNQPLPLPSGVENTAVGRGRGGRVMSRRMQRPRPAPSGGLRAQPSSDRDDGAAPGIPESAEEEPHRQRAAVGGLRVTGDLSSDVVRRVLARYRAQFSRGLAPGQYRIRLVIGANGRVRLCNEGTAGACPIPRVQRLRFPTSSGETTVEFVLNVS